MLARWLSILLSTLRTFAAAALLFLCWQHLPAMQAWDEFEALPDYDYATEGRGLLQQERFSEALLVVEAGLQGATPEQQPGLEMLKAEIETERDRLLRRLEEAGQGALTGRGESVEALAGAVVADLFVFGDVRDLIIEGGKTLRGEDNDEVIVALSAAGLVLTVAPGLDAGAALLKFARKAGALTEAFGRQLVRLARRAIDEKDIAPLGAVAGDVVTLGKAARPAGAIAILKHVDDPADLRRAAEYAQRPGGAFALWLGGKEALAWLKASGKSGEDLLLRAARKGRAGIAYVAGKGSLLLSPHPLLGLIKGFWKGNIPDLLLQSVQRWAGAIFGFALAWLAFETALLMWRLARPARRKIQSTPLPSEQPEPILPRPATRQEPRIQ